MLIRAKVKVPWGRGTAICLLAMLLIALCAPNISAQTTLAAQLILRPMTPDDIAAYGLPSTTETSGGLTTVGLGQPAYLEADVDINVPASQIASVTWTLASKPTGSNAVLAADPLGSGVPVFLPSDKLIYQVAGRKLLRPDVAGVYNVSATITTVGSGVATLEPHAHCQ